MRHPREAVFFILRGRWLERVFIGVVASHVGRRFARPLETPFRFPLAHAPERMVFTGAPVGGGVFFPRASAVKKASIFHSFTRPLVGKRLRNFFFPVFSYRLEYAQ